jgi:hypothetical protein
MSKENLGLTGSFVYVLTNFERNLTNYMKKLLKSTKILFFQTILIWILSTTNSVRRSKKEYNSGNKNISQRTCHVYKETALVENINLVVQFLYA